MWLNIAVTVICFHKDVITHVILVLNVIYSFGNGVILSCLIIYSLQIEVDYLVFINVGMEPNEKDGKTF